MKALVECLPRVAKEVYLYGMIMDYDDLSTILKVCRNVQRLVINFCTIKPIGNLEFNIDQDYHIQFLSFRHSGDSSWSNWSKNKNKFRDLMTAIKSSGLKHSLNTFDIYKCGVDESEATIDNVETVEIFECPPL